MVLLVIFAFIAGAATAMSPCALPVLPVVLAAGVDGGRRRPLGIATGLALSFTFATVALVYVISALGLPNNFLRLLAVSVLLIFGISLLVPSVSMRIEGFISRMTAGSANRVMQATSSTGKTNADGTPQQRGDGFWSGMIVGGGLGFVYAPCAGPILAGAITVTASQEFTTSRLIVALAYGIGSAVTFFAMMIGGRKLMRRMSARTELLQRVTGIAMVLVAVAMFANLDTRFQTAIANDLPAFLVNPTKELEESSSAKAKLAQATGRETKNAEGGDEAAGGEALPKLGPAPEFVGNQQWFNTASGQPLTLAELKGKVVLVDFWTYTCINCLRTLPYIKAWDQRYRDKGFVVVGVHSPEFPFEKSASNVQAAIKQNKLKYPVVQDNNLATWDAYQNQYWPAKYLIDAEGQVRYTHFGEGDYDVTEQAIRSLLDEAGSKGLGKDMTEVKAEVPSNVETTPETYLGAARAQRFANGQITTGTQNFGNKRGRLDLSELRYGGRWRVTEDGATAAGPTSNLQLHFRAKKVFLVLGSTGNSPRTVRVLLDGKPVTATRAGSDVKNATATIKRQRLYRLIELPRVGDHLLELQPQAGVSGYAFTFG